MQKRGVDYYSAAQQLFRLEITYKVLTSDFDEIVELRKEVENVKQNEYDID